MENLLSDLRHGVRLLLANPGFTLIAVLALALGIGANSAIFSVVNAILLRPLPYSHPERIVSIWSVNPTVHIGIDRLPVSAAEFVDYRDQSDVFDHIAAFSSGALNLEGRGEPEKPGTTRVTADFFAVLGVQAALGRTFLPEEDQPGHDNEVVLSHSL